MIVCLLVVPLAVYVNGLSGDATMIICKKPASVWAETSNSRRTYLLEYPGMLRRKRVHPLDSGPVARVGHAFISHEEHDDPPYKIPVSFQQITILWAEGELWHRVNDDSVVEPPTTKDDARTDVRILRQDTLCERSVWSSPKVDGCLTHPVVLDLSIECVGQ